MSDSNAKEKKKEFFKSLPESITGPKDDKEYPRKNMEWFLDSFRKDPNGTINIEHVRSSVEFAIACLYHDGFLTIKPLKVIASEKKLTNIANETYEWVTIETFLDKSGH
jgi:hypothetical protein